MYVWRLTLNVSVFQCGRVNQGYSQLLVRIMVQVKLGLQCNAHVYASVCVSKW